MDVRQYKGTENSLFVMHRCTFHVIKRDSIDILLIILDGIFFLLKYDTYDINDKLYKSIIEILKRKKNQYYNHRYHYHHFR